MNVCGARQGSAQSAMTQAKKQTLNQSMEQSIKQSVRELWSVGVTIQHRINARKQVASSCVFTRSNREQMLVLGQGISSPTHQKMRRLHPKIHRLVDRRRISRPRNLASSDSVKVSCGGAGPGEQSWAGGQDNHPVRRELW